MDTLKVGEGKSKDSIRVSVEKSPSVQRRDSVAITGKGKDNISGGAASESVSHPSKREEARLLKAAQQKAFDKWVPRTWEEMQQKDPYVLYRADAEERLKQLPESERPKIEIDVTPGRLAELQRIAATAGTAEDELTRDKGATWTGRKETDAERARTVLEFYNANPLQRWILPKKSGLDFFNTVSVPKPEYFNQDILNDENYAYKQIEQGIFGPYALPTPQSSRGEKQGMGITNTEEGSWDSRLRDAFNSQAYGQKIGQLSLLYTMQESGQSRGLVGGYAGTGSAPEVDIEGNPVPPPPPPPPPPKPRDDGTWESLAAWEGRAGPVTMQESILATKGEGDSTPESIAKVRGYISKGDVVYRADGSAVNKLVGDVSVSLKTGQVLSENATQFASQFPSNKSSVEAGAVPSVDALSQSILVEVFTGDEADKNKNISALIAGIENNPNFIKDITNSDTYINRVTGYATEKGNLLYGLTGKVFRQPVGEYATIVAPSQGFSSIMRIGGTEYAFFRDPSDPLGAPVAWNPNPKGQGTSLNTIHWDEDKPDYPNNFSKASNYAKEHGVEATWQAIKDSVDNNGKAIADNPIGLEGSVLISPMGKYVQPQATLITWTDFTKMYPQYAYGGDYIRLANQVEGELSLIADREKKKVATDRDLVVKSLIDANKEAGGLDYINVASLINYVDNQLATINKALVGYQVKAGDNIWDITDDKSRESIQKSFLNSVKYTAPNIDYRGMVERYITDAQKALSLVSDDPMVKSPIPTDWNYFVLNVAKKANGDYKKIFIELSKVVEDAQSGAVPMAGAPASIRGDIGVGKPIEANFQRREPTGFGEPVEADVLYPTFKYGESGDVGGPKGAGKGIYFKGTGDVDFGGVVGTKQIDVEYFVVKNADGSVGGLWWREPGTSWFEGDYKYLPDQSAVTGVTCRGRTCQLHEDDLNIAVKYIVDKGFESFEGIAEAKVISLPEQKWTSPVSENITPIKEADLPPPPIDLKQDYIYQPPETADTFTKWREEYEGKVRDGIINPMQGIFAGKNILGEYIFMPQNAYDLLTQTDKDNFQKKGITAIEQWNGQRDQIRSSKLSDYRDSDGRYYLKEFSISARNNGLTPPEIENILRLSNFTDKDIQYALYAIPPDGYASDAELSKMTIYERAEYLTTHADDVRFAGAGLLFTVSPAISKEVDMATAVNMAQMVPRKYANAKVLADINADSRMTWWQKQEAIATIFGQEASQESEDVRNSFKPLWNVEENPQIATVLRVLDLSRLVTSFVPGNPLLIPQVVNALIISQNPQSYEKGLRDEIQLYDKGRQLVAEAWTPEQTGKILTDWYNKEKGELTPIVGEGAAKTIADVANAPRTFNAYGVQAIWEMVKTMGGVIPLTLLKMSPHMKLGEMNEVAASTVELAGGMVMMPVAEFGVAAGGLSRGEFAKVGGRLTGLGITMVVSPAHLAKAGVKGTVFLGDFTIRNGEVFLSRAFTEGGGGLAHLNVPKSFYKLTDELNNIFADKATVAKYLAIKDPIAAELHLKSLLSAESRPVWEATKQMVELAHQYGDLPTSWYTDKVNFSQIRDFPQVANEAVRKVFQNNKNSGYFKGSLADVSQIQDSTLRALIGEQYGRIGDGDYVVTNSGAKAVDIANQVVDAMNDAAGKKVAYVDGTANNAKVRLINGQKDLFQIHTEGSFSKKPFGWESKFTFVDVDGIKMTNFKDQLFRRGDIVLYPATQEMAGTFGLMAETATTGAETLAVTRRSLKDWYRLKYQVQLIAENLKDKGKIDVANQLKEYLDIAESGVKVPFKKGGTVLPVEVSGKEMERPLVLTDQAKKDVFEVFGILQEVAMAEGKSAYFVTPEGTIFRTVSPSEQLLQNDLIHVTRDIRPYLEYEKQGKTLKAGYVLDEKGNYVPIPDKQIFFSPQAALDYLNSIDAEHGGLVMLRATEADRAKYLDVVDRVESYPEAKVATFDVFGKKISIGKTEIVDKVFDEMVLGKKPIYKTVGGKQVLEGFIEGEAYPLGSKYSVRGTEGIEKYPMVWFAMEDAMSKGLGIPDMATVKAINSLAWKQAIKDYLHPRLNKNIQVIFDPLATGKGGGPIDFGEGSWTWKKETPEMVQALLEKEKAKLSAPEAIAKLNDELKSIVAKGDDVAQSFSKITQGQVDGIKQFILDRAKASDDATLKMAQDTVDRINIVKDTISDVAVKQRLVDIQAKLDNSINILDAQNIPEILKDARKQLNDLKVQQTKDVLAQNLNKTIESMVNTIDDKILRLDDIRITKEIKPFKNLEEYYKITSIGDRGYALWEIRERLTQESRQVWDATFQLGEELFRATKGMPLKDAPTIDFKSAFGARLSADAANKIKTVVKKYGEEGYLGGSFGDFYQMYGIDLPDFMKPKDADIHLFKGSRVTPEQYGNELMESLVDMGDTVEDNVSPLGNKRRIIFSPDKLDASGNVIKDGEARFVQFTDKDGISSEIMDYRFKENGETFIDIVPSSLFGQDLTLKEWKNLKTYVDIDGITVNDIRNQFLDRITVLLMPAVEDVMGAAGAMQKVGMAGTFGQRAETALTGSKTGVRSFRGRKDWDRTEYLANYFIDRIEKSGDIDLATALRDRLEIAKAGVKTVAGREGIFGKLVDELEFATGISAKKGKIGGAGTTELGFVTGTPEMWQAAGIISKKAGKKVVDAAKLKKMVREGSSKISEDYLVNLADLSRIYYSQLPITKGIPYYSSVPFTVIPSEAVTVEGIVSTVVPTVVSSGTFGATSLPATPIITTSVSTITTTPITTPTTPPTTPTTPPTVPTTPPTTPTTPPTHPTTPPTYPTTPPTPPIPPKPPRKTPPTYPPFERKRKWEELTREQKLAAIVWRQGWANYALASPYTQKDLIYSNKPFAGTKVHSGPKAAYKSVAKVKGAQLPDRIDIDLGIMDLTFVRDKDGNDVKVFYRADPLQKTTGKGPSNMPEPLIHRTRKVITQVSSLG